MYLFCPTNYIAQSNENPQTSIRCCLILNSDDNQSFFSVYKLKRMFNEDEFSMQTKVAGGYRRVLNISPYDLPNE